MCVHVGSVGSHRSTVAPGGFIQLVDPCPPPPYRRHPTPHLRLLLDDLAGGERTQVDLLVPYSRFERCRAPICLLVRLRFLRHLHLCLFFFHWQVTLALLVLVLLAETLFVPGGICFAGPAVIPGLLQLKDEEAQVPREEAPQEDKFLGVQEGGRPPGGACDPALPPRREGRLQEVKLLFYPYPTLLLLLNQFCCWYRISWRIALCWPWMEEETFHKGLTEVLWLGWQVQWHMLNSAKAR